ncbi:hypothetical protein [Chitinophaga arvensicola]|uniref:Uncharacterized protein n=1 Tax=Chitinophaga arvensicola TaxID=29529 RepID=A0A1I0SDJ4_9BACT|nr:hypothetical protein [Chitinophaga arvensicola]SEW56223.1 hypothetical protein SAMN04488122_6599 [Chitinophaga arvensicola]
MRNIRYRLNEDRSTLLSVVLLLSLTACHQNRIEEPDTIAVAAPSEKVQPLTEEEDSLQEVKRNISWDQIEVFVFSQARINNKVPLFTTKARLETAIGTADSVISARGEDICGSQFEDDFDFLYKEGATFELCKDSLACEELVFNAHNSLTWGKITFTRNTTWENIKQLFPNAVLQAENEGRRDMITLRDAYSKDSDSSVKLYFEDGKLVRIINFIPC